MAQLVRTPVTAVVEKTSWTSRKIHASITIRAPVAVVWGCLTDYQGLDSFIPSLVENKCLERKVNGAVLLQVGAQEVALGIKFSARTTLDCTEYPQGIPSELYSSSGDGSDGLLPFPQACRLDVSNMDISFVSLEGDFKAFRGIWRMQPCTPDQDSTDSGAGSSDEAGGAMQGSEEYTLLCYSLYVQPQKWLPVSVLQGRIEKEVRKNLEAVRVHTEMLAVTVTESEQQGEPSLAA